MSAIVTNPGRWKVFEARLSLLRGGGRRSFPLHLQLATSPAQRGTASSRDRGWVGSLHAVTGALEAKAQAPWRLLPPIDRGAEAATRRAYLLAPTRLAARGEECSHSNPSDWLMIRTRSGPVRARPRRSQLVSSRGRESDEPSMSSALSCLDAAWLKAPSSRGSPTSPAPATTPELTHCPSRCIPPCASPCMPVPSCGLAEQPCILAQQCF